MKTTATQWKQHIDAWQKSTLSQAKYCQANQLNQNQFSYWKHKLAGREKNLSCRAPAGFAVATLALAPKPPAPISALSITLAGGAVISGIDDSNYPLVIKLLEALQ